MVFEVQTDRAVQTERNTLGWTLSFESLHQTSFATDESECGGLKAVALIPFVVQRLSYFPAQTIIACGIDLAGDI